MWINIQNSYINFNTVHQFYNIGNVIYLVNINKDTTIFYFNNDVAAEDKLREIKTILAIQDL